MATQKLKDLLGQELVTLADKFLIVSTIRDGYTGTYKGNHPYRVVQDENGEYAVYPVYMNSEGVLVNEKYPIIQTDSGVVFYTICTTIDPYNFARFEGVADANTKEDQVLLAFEAFIWEEFRLGIYNVFIDSEPALADDEVPFEFTTEFERDVINPNAGDVNTPA